MTAARPTRAVTRLASACWLWGPVVAAMVVIFVLSSMSDPPAPDRVSDKLLHTAGYAALALVTVRATSGGRLAGLTPRSAVGAWAIATAYGASDELHQRFVPGRSAELADLGADGLGAALGLAAAGAFAIIHRSRAARPAA